MLVAKIWILRSTQTSLKGALMDKILDIACDEAGHTGPDLLNRDQRIFVFSSVAIGDDEAYEIIAKARADSPVAMPELKASKLLKSERGRKLITDCFASANGRYAVNTHDKLLALCGWFFEYIYEPVYQDNPRLLYEKNLHRFVAMYAYLWFSDAGSEAKSAIEQFQRYMRSLDPNDAPCLFDRPRPPLTEDGTEHPFESVLRFAYGYRDIIIADNARLGTTLPEGARWTLDLSTSALWSHLNHWGARGMPLCVRCDASKPLHANAANIRGDATDPGIHRARMTGHEGRLGWTFAEPIAFCDLRNHPSIQLADVIAGTTFALASGLLPQGCEEIIQSINQHGLADLIWPDADIIDPKNRSAAVNSLMLYDLAKRAERLANPYENLDLMYHLTEVEWTKGNSPFRNRE